MNLKQNNKIGLEENTFEIIVQEMAVIRSGFNILSTNNENVNDNNSNYICFTISSTKKVLFCLKQCATNGGLRATFLGTFINQNNLRNIGHLCHETKNWALNTGVCNVRLSCCAHDDDMTWKHVPHCCSSMRGNRTEEW